MADFSGNQGDKDVYDTKPELTQDQTQKAQQNLNKQLQQFEARVEIEMRGDCTCNPTMQLLLTGTGTAFDRTYDIMTVTHHISTEHGYTMHIAGHSGGSGGDGGGGGGGGGGS